MNKIFIGALLICFASCAAISDYMPSGVRSDRSPLTVIWSKNNDPAYDTGNLPIALNSPLVHDGIVYVGHNSGKMMAYQSDTGRLVWSSHDSGTYHAFPAVYKEQLLYGTTEGRFFSRDLVTGKEKFSIDLGSSVETAPFIYNGRVLLQTRNHKLFCLDVLTGKVLWSYKRSVPFLTTLQRASRPVVKDNKIFVGFADGTVAAFNLEEGMLLWERKIADGSKFIDIDSSPVIFSGKLLMTSLAGTIAVIDPNTGAVIRRLPIVSSRAPYVDGNKLVIGSSEGELVLFNSSFEEVKRQHVSERGISSIVNWKGSYAFATIAGEVGVVNKGLTHISEIHHLGHSSSAVFGTLSAGENGELALLSSRNRLYVFK